MSCGQRVHSRDFSVSIISQATRLPKDIGQPATAAVTLDNKIDKLSTLSLPFFKIAPGHRLPVNSLQHDSNGTSPTSATRDMQWIGSQALEFIFRWLRTIIGGCNVNIIACCRIK